MRSLEGLGGLGFAITLLAAVGCAPARVPELPASHVVGAIARPPVNPTSWAVPNWDIDNANSTTCASDTNTCTSATCGAAGSAIGPCKTYGEVIGRWGTASPVLAQATRVTFLSDDTEPTFDVTPIIVAGGSLIYTGTLVVAGSGTVASVTAKNRATPQRLTVGLGQAASGFIGLVFSDTTHPSYSWVDYESSGNSAVLTQPFSHAADCTTLPTEQDTVTVGDAYQILHPVVVPIRTWNPVLRGNASGGLGTGQMCLEHLWVPDATGVPGTTGFDFGLSAAMTELRIDPNAFSRINNQPQEPAYNYNVFDTGGAQANASTQNGTAFVGGALYASRPTNPHGDNIANNGGFILDGDIAAKGFVLMANGPGFVGTAYISSHLEILNSTVQMENNVAGGPALWGPGFIQVGTNSILLLQGATATSTLLNTGGIVFGLATNVTTGCALDSSVDPALTHCNRTLTPAHLDATVASGGFGGAALDPFLQSTIAVGER